MRAPLIDRFGRKHTYLRISVTDRCNFRCVYCMPEEGYDWLKREDVLDYEEVARLTRLLAEMGVNKVRLTGGEPTVRKRLETLITMIAEIPGIDSLLMTTNGFVLREKASVYRKAGLTGLNISCDTLRQERFKEITRTDHFAKVWDGILAALETGYESIKVNVVVMAGVNEDELLDFVELTRKMPINVRFIEFMPFDGNKWTRGRLYPYRKMRADIETKYKLEPLACDPSAVGKDFAVPGFAGTIGFVTSMTEDFCGGCNRIRLTAEGNLKPCLFSNVEESLRDPLRAGASDDELDFIIRETLNKKPKAHAPANQLPQFDNRPMVTIGG
jgi:molybdenum cofactor biosynthesis protein A